MFQMNAELYIQQRILGEKLSYFHKNIKQHNHLQHW